MSGLQSRQHRQPDCRDLVTRQRATSADGVGEGPAPHELHHEPWLAFLVDDVVHPHCSRCVHRRDRTGLTQRLRGQASPVGGQHSSGVVDLLDRHRPVQQLVVGLPDDSHAAATELDDESVSAREGRGHQHGLPRIDGSDPEMTGRAAVDAAPTCGWTLPTAGRGATAAGRSGSASGCSGGPSSSRRAGYPRAGGPTRCSRWSGRGRDRPLPLSA